MMRGGVWLIAGLLAAYWLFGRSDAMPLGTLEFREKRPAAEQQTRLVGGNCASERCLLVYLAPWCGVCRNSHQTIVDAVNRLRDRKVNATVVLGMAPRDELVAYAREFPFPVYFDPDKSFFNDLSAKGVPYQAVWDSGGAIVADVSGGFRSADQLLQYLQLPM